MTATRLVEDGPAVVRRRMDELARVDGLCGLCGAAWPCTSCPAWRIAGWVAPGGVAA